MDLIFVHKIWAAPDTRKRRVCWLYLLSDMAYSYQGVRASGVHDTGRDPSGLVMAYVSARQLSEQGLSMFG